MHWLKRHTTSLIATILLIAFGIVLIASSWNDSTTVDEISHIGAGYSYLTQQDMRLNPEHPPLAKDLAALPLLALDLTFPLNTDGWRTQANGQWAVGEKFLYLAGNDAERMIRLARLPVMLLSIALGWLLFLWARKTYDDTTALLTLFFYVTSPTIIAHSRYVTTDIAATFGFVLGIITFLWWLKKPSWKRVIVFGMTLGVVMLLKFSLVLLLPIYALVILLWCFAQKFQWKDVVSAYLQMVAAGLVASVLIWIVYLWHIWDYPTAKAVADAVSQIEYYKKEWLIDFTIFMMNHWITRPWGQYILGVVMVLQRTSTSNTAYFLGEVGKEGWSSYFPVLYVVKETLAFHVLTVVAAISTFSRIGWKVGVGGERLPRQGAWFGAAIEAVRKWMRLNFVVVVCVVVIGLYWAATIQNPLNIGVRHVLPTFPFIYLLVARGLRGWLTSTWRWRVFFVAAAWIIVSLALTFPYYVSYYNELAGGTKNGYRIAVDSNYDWGQDLKRLSQYIDANPNEIYYVDYFGNTTPESGPQQYWLGKEFHEWHSDSGKPPSGSVFVVSIGFFVDSTATFVEGYDGKGPADLYPWLEGATPFERVGTTLFLYRIP